ncbi:MAG TPA: alpha-amylase family glycosyl hydrolase, partial [Candidatus Methylacidiphilales bacterium]|nr:alpha-amylase family glycosyl hydrolase [Candidatus Methylacidiphilales bacterium]
MTKILPKSSHTYSRWLCLLLLATLLGLPCATLAQRGLEDDRVMLQGFFWESMRHGGVKLPIGTKKWYDIVKDAAPMIKDGRFDMVWLPPPSDAGEHNEGYVPEKLFLLKNSYGDEAQHRAVLQALYTAGAEPIADIVINHRNGSDGSWAQFKFPEWGTFAITRNDECFSDSASEVKGTPIDKRGAEEETPREYRGTPSDSFGYRDLDHTNIQVRKDIVKYLRYLKSFGYRGWRYDMVVGYHARWISVYNHRSNPTFSVGEYWKEDNEGQGQIRGWIWHTATKPDKQGMDQLATCSAAFDFPGQATLRHNVGKYDAWYGFGNGIGLAGDTTTALRWCNKAVTFLENHDTAYRMNKDTGLKKDHDSADDFVGNKDIEQGYAYILTHPGIPCVFWKHFFDRGDDMRNAITALINARKVAKVHAGSKLHLQDNARKRGVYAAAVDGRAGQLYVRIGGDSSAWQPSDSKYKD